MLAFKHRETSKREAHEEALGIDLNKEKARRKNDQIKDRAQCSVLSQAVLRQIEQRQHPHQSTKCRYDNPRERCSGDRIQAKHLERVRQNPYHQGIEQEERIIRRNVCVKTWVSLSGGKALRRRDYSLRCKMRRPWVVITAHGDGQIIFRVPCHLIIHEWVEQIDMIELITGVCKILRPLQGEVREFWDDSRRRQRLKDNYNERPGQP